MTPLHRHQLAWLSPAGWGRVFAGDWDATARACLEHWAAQRLPLVVTRQPGDGAGPDPAIAMGLPAPARWQRRRLALAVPRADVLFFGDFPRAEEVTPLLPRATRASWRRLCAGLRATGAAARVYGSYGWQRLSGLDHVHARSDLDLWIAVSDFAQADAAVALLRDFPPGGPRLDGELAFDGGIAVAWREWADWRAGAARSLLIRTLSGASLSSGFGARGIPGAVDRAECAP
jgi:phosphoribosyl-dephospho-CoA transferase